MDDGSDITVIAEGLGNVTDIDVARGMYVCYSFRRIVDCVISVSLAIRIAEQSAIVTEMSSHVCLSAHRYFGKTADWIWW